MQVRTSICRNSACFSASALASSALAASARCVLGASSSSADVRSITCEGYCVYQDPDNRWQCYATQCCAHWTEAGSATAWQAHVCTYSTDQCRMAGLPAKPRHELHVRHHLPAAAATPAPHHPSDRCPLRAPRLCRPVCMPSETKPYQFGFTNWWHDPVHPCSQGHGSFLSLSSKGEALRCMHATGRLAPGAIIMEYNQGLAVHHNPVGLRTHRLVRLAARLC